MKLILMLAVSIVVLSAGFATYSQERPVVKIGYVPGIEINFMKETLIPTLNYLQKRLPQYKFEALEVPATDTQQGLLSYRLNFFLAPADYHYNADDSISILPLVSRKTKNAPSPSRSLGSVFVVKANRTDIKSIADLKNKTIIASFQTSIGGWLAALREVYSQGFAPDSFFKKVYFTQFQVPDVFNVVLDGNADAGVLPTCMLETAEETGLLKKGSLRILEPKNGSFPASERHKCQHSTSVLYPDFIFATLSGTPEELTKKVTIALLSMPDFGDYSWSNEIDTSQITQLYRDLKIGPFAYLGDYSIKNLYRLYKREFWLAVLLLALLLINEFRLHWLVNKRTRELKQALNEKEQSEEIAKQERKKLSLLERNGVISQMSSLLAHEAKQPISTIINYIEVMRMRLGSFLEEDELLKKALTVMDYEAQRLDLLINSVRNFAKKRYQPLESTDLIEIAHKAVRTFNRNEPDFKEFRIEFECELVKARIKADVLSLELLILNLIRNGAQASVGQKKGIRAARVGIRIERFNGSRYKLDVWNTGDEMTDEQMKRLISLGESIKTEGLGIGLAIIRDIVDHHGSDLKFSKRKGGGVVASFYIDREESADHGQ